MLSSIVQGYFPYTLSVLKTLFKAMYITSKQANGQISGHFSAHFGQIYNMKKNFHARW